MHQTFSQCSKLALLMDGGYIGLLVGAIALLLIKALPQIVGIVCSLLYKCCSSQCLSWHHTGTRWCWWRCLLRLVPVAAATPPPWGRPISILPHPAVDPGEAGHAAGAPRQLSRWHLCHWQWWQWGQCWACCLTMCPLACCFHPAHWLRPPVETGSRPSATWPLSPIPWFPKFVGGCGSAANWANIVTTGFLPWLGPDPPSKLLQTVPYTHCHPQGHGDKMAESQRLEHLLALYIQ